MEAFFDYIDVHQDYFVGKLKDAVAIPRCAYIAEYGMLMAEM